MKIIKEGNADESLEQIVSCHKCHTEFSFTNEDIKIDRDGCYVECPKCKSFIDAEMKYKS